MRNWHHKIIKVEEALGLITTPFDQIIVSVIEGVIEYKILDGYSGDPIPYVNYEPTHHSFSDINGLKKIFLRRYSSINSEKVFKSSTPKTNITSPSFHAVGVTGIITAKNINGNNLAGIIQNSRIINSFSLWNSIIVSTINDITAKNVLSSDVYKRSYLRSMVNLPGQNKQLQFIPENIPNDTLEYNHIRAGIINNSYEYKGKEINFTDDSLKQLNSTDVIFIHQELFAYGRNGRGTLSIYAAGNGKVDEEHGGSPTGIILTDQNRIVTKSKKSLIVGASIINLNENNYQLLSSGYLNNTLLIPEKKATYSNYGERLDLVAPSSPRSIPKSDELGIYAPSIINGGEIGSDDQILKKEVISVNSNNKSIVLNNVLGLFPGQTVEIGDYTSFLHEIRVIKEVNNSTNTITLEQPLEFTKKFSGNFSIVGEKIRVTILKIQVLSREGNEPNRFRIKNRRGLCKVPLKANQRQNVFIYNQDNNNSDIINSEDEETHLRLITRVVGIWDRGSYYTIEFENAIPEVENLFIIPDIMEIKVRSELNSTSQKYNSFKCKNDYNLDGFFVGQQIKIDGYKTNISKINDDNKTFITSHYNVGQASDFNVVSTSYGNYTSSFGGTSSSAPIVTGVAALVLAANSNLNAAEIKHILKATTDHIDSSSSNYQPVMDITKYNYGYNINTKYGTGRVNAFNAVTMAKNWNNTPKPRLEIFDDSDSNGFNSPDIIINNNANITNIDLNSSSVNHSIKVKVRNTGNRQSFIESDVRLLIIFVPEKNGVYDSEILKFEFPKYWHNTLAKSGADPYRISLLGVKEIGIIEPGSFKEIEFNFTKEQLKMEKLRSGFSGNYRAFILVHLAPFDGLSNEVQLNNFRNNKQLTCKEIFFSDAAVIEGTGALPGNKLDITVGQELVEKTFDLSLENIATASLNTTKIKATKVSTNQLEEHIFFSKDQNDNVWKIEDGLDPQWIKFETPDEIASQYDGYKHIKFPHKITVNNSSEKIKIETLNA